jgi:transcriptional regulator with XRE-family HTH domain
MGQRRRPKRLAEKLKQIRETLGLSQREMAARLNERAGVKTTNKSVSNYEREKNVPFLETVLAYSRLANVNMDQILDDDLELKRLRKRRSL